MKKDTLNTSRPIIQSHGYNGSESHANLSKMRR